MKRKTFLFTLVLLIGVSMTGYAGRMISGKLYSLKDGSVISCSIEYSQGQGRMEALNAKTGEKFEGTYTGVYETDRAAKCKGILIGDQGTIISLTMEINVGSSPFGFGDGEDNNGLKYQYQTSVGKN
jgi:hypothetical protein